MERQEAPAQRLVERVVALEPLLGLAGLEPEPEHVVDPALGCHREGSLVIGTCWLADSDMKLHCHPGAWDFPILMRRHARAGGDDDPVQPSRSPVASVR